MFVNSTEIFDTTGTLENSPKDNESSGGGGDVTTTSTHSLTLQPMTTTTATTLATPLPQNRFFVATDTTDQHITEPNEISAASYNTNSTRSTKSNSTNNMTSSYDSRNSSNTSFSVRFTTMKPCKRNEFVSQIKLSSGWTSTAFETKLETEKGLKLAFWEILKFKSFVFSSKLDEQSKNSKALEILKASLISKASANPNLHRNAFFISKCLSIIWLAKKLFTTFLLQNFGWHEKAQKSFKIDLVQYFWKSFANKA